MKYMYQVLFSLKDNEKVFVVSSAAVVIGAFRVISLTTRDENS